MVQLPPLDREKTIELARSIEKTLNGSYSVFAKKELNADVHFFSIKFEKIYARFFQAGKKKRYAGSLVWKEGKDVHETDIVGFEIKRSDTPQITKFVQMTVMEQILEGKGYPEIKAFLSDVIKKYRAGKYTLDEIGIPGGIGKSLDDYDNDDAQVRGAKYANLHLHTEFGKGSKPKRIYIRNVTSKYPEDRCALLRVRGPGPGRVRGRLGTDAGEDDQAAHLADHRGARLGMERCRPLADHARPVGPRVIPPRPGSAKKHPDREPVQIKNV